QIAGIWDSGVRSLRQGLRVATDAPTQTGVNGGSGPGKLAREVSSLQASLLGKLHEEMAGGDATLFAAAAQKLAEEFGSGPPTAIGPPWGGGGAARGGGAEA